MPTDPFNLTRTRATPPRDPTAVTATGPTSAPDGTVVATPADSIARASAVSPRQAVPGFEIVAELGRGGMGVVYRARQVALNRTVALKMILTGEHADPVAQARFLIEAEAVAAVRHPHVVQVFEFGRHDGLPYFAMEFVDGGSLADRVRREGRLDPRAAAALVADLADGVAAAHAAGIVHRDLKPANVLLTEAGAPKVTDFGLAKVRTSDVTVTGAVLGTPGYMSPEQAAGARDVGTAADVWGLGAVLYALLAGGPPFRGETWRHTVELVLTTEPARPRALAPAVPRDLETVCLKCLEKDPRRRYPTADALAADLRAFLDGRPIAARPAGAAERVAKWARRHPGRAGAAAAAVVVAAAAAWGGFAYWAEVVRADADRVKKDAEVAVAVKDAEVQKRLTEAERFHAGRSRVRERRALAPPGWGPQNLDELAALAGMPDAAAHRPELRSEAAAALAVVELRRTGAAAPGTLWYVPAYSPDGRTLAVGAWRATPDLRVEVRLLDPATGAARATRWCEAHPGETKWTGPRDGCRSLAFSPDGRWLVAGLNSGRLARWDLSAADPAAAAWPGHAADNDEPRDRNVARLGFTTDSRALLSNTPAGVIRVWDAAGGWGERAFAFGAFLPDADAYPPDDVPVGTKPAGQYGRFDPQTGNLTRGPEYARVYAVSPAGAFLFGWAPGVHGPALRRTAVPGPVRAFQGTGPDFRSPTFRCVRFTPDGGFVVTTEEHERRLAVWDVAGGRLVGTRAVSAGESSGRFRLAPDGRTAAVCESDAVGLYEVTGGVRRTVGVSPESDLEAAAVSPDGRELLLATFEEETADRAPLRLYRWAVADRPSPAAGDAVAVFDDPFDRTLLAQSPTDRAWVCTAGAPPRLVHPTAGALPADNPEDMCFGPDGRLWFADGQSARLLSPGAGRWDARTLYENKDPVRQRGSVFRAVAAGAGGAVFGRRDGLLFRFGADGRAAGTEAVSDSAVTALALAADGRTLLVGTAGGAVHVRADGAAPVVIGDAHGHDVVSVAVGPGFFATGSLDGTVRLWRPGGEPLLALRFSGGVRRVVLPGDGRYLYVHVVGERGVRRWDLRELGDALDRIGLGLAIPGG